MTRKTEYDQAIADQEWWCKVGEKLGLRVVGWTYRVEAQFVDPETSASVYLPGSVGRRLVPEEA